MENFLDLYSDYLLCSTKQTSATGLSVMLDGSVSHDQITRFLSGHDFDSKKLWLEVKPLIRQNESAEACLIFDDTIIEKQYMDENELICWHWDHSKGRNIKGINLLSAFYVSSLPSSENTGRLLWKWDGGLTRMHFSPAAVWPVAAHGKVFFSAPDRVLTALDAETGKTIWRTKESMVRETIGLSADETRIYSKTMQDSVVCYSAVNNEPQKIWSVNVGYGYDHAPSMPVEKNNVVFGSTKNGLIFALDAKTGQLRWKHKKGNSLISTVVPLNGRECLYTSSEGMVGLLLDTK